MPERVPQLSHMNFTAIACSTGLQPWAGDESKFPEIIFAEPISDINLDKITSAYLDEWKSLITPFHFNQPFFKGEENK